MATYGLTPADIAAIAYIVLTVIGLMIVYSILKRIIRKIVEVWSKGSLFGGDQKTRLISLGVVAILFPSMFYFIGNAIINFIGNFYVDMPRSLVTNWQTNQSFCLDYDGSSFRLCITQMGYGFVQAWTSAFSDTLGYFGPSYISYSKLILMLAVWASVAIFFSAASTKDKDNPDGAEPKVRLQTFFEQLTPTTKQNLMFFLILVLAGYLSIAAIAAIPGLEETAAPSETVSVENLERQLQDAFTQSQARIPGQLQLSDPIVIPTVDSTSSVNSDVSSDENIDDIVTSSINDYFKLLRDQWSSMYSKLYQDVQIQAGNLKDLAISSYRASIINRKGTKETTQHFLDIDAWFRQELNRMEAQLAECRRQIGSLDSLINSLNLQSNELSFDNTIYQVFQNAEKNTREACQSISISDTVPERQDLGSNMGPFSYIASWLLRTESLPLAQIVGLLGFGLLGSAVSSLVRNNAQRNKNQPLVEELATVIIRGATAAVVVFLAVKGGLAIFSSGESNPNSYVLLLTCLVAAVFSEDVWGEARNRLSKALKGDNEVVTEQVVHTTKTSQIEEISVDTLSSEKTLDDESHESGPA